MILGVAGPYGAGKGEVVEFLRERSFYALSLSDVIRAALREQGLEETRERMIETGNALRTAGGPGVLAEKLLAQLLPDRNYVIDSVRHPSEVEVLRRVGAGLPPALGRRRRGCPARAAARAEAAAGIPATLDALRGQEGRELRSDDPAAQQLLAVRELADFRLRNDDTLAALHSALQEVLERCLHFERPGWDEYFMSIARMVASRSNCVKRKVGAVIARDRRIISTGYNGTPRGARNCNEGGCPRCNAFAQGGTRLDECLCSHGEENAITQAAYHGVSVRGGIVYSTFAPCLTCTKMIINAGIEEVLFNADYPLGEVSLALLREAGLKIRQISLPA